MDRRSFLKSSVLTAAGVSLGGFVSGMGKEVPQRPNFLVITVDDMSFETPGCYGNKTPGITPNIDRLASEGMKFEQAFVTVSICQPSRSVWITGSLPHHNGTTGFNPISPFVPRLGEVLRGGGYYTGIVGKVSHYAPATESDWDHIVHSLPGGGRDPKQYPAMVEEFTKKAKATGKPFFLLVNITDPHRPFATSEKEKQIWGANEAPQPSRVYRPNEIEVPGFLPDLPDVRREVCEYLNTCKRADDSVGMILDALDKARLDETCVIFMSDNGAPLPFAKGGVYRQSNQSPMIIRQPGAVRPGSIDKDNFINGYDFMPTVLDLAGIEQPKNMDGRSFAGALSGRKLEGFDAGYCVFIRAHTRTLNQRAIHTKKWTYIYNEWVAWEDGDNIFIADNMIPIMYDGAAKDAEIAKRVDFYKQRSPEELYDIERDPWAMDNLAYEPGHFDTLNMMRDRMKKWLDEKGDPCRNSMYKFTARTPKLPPAGGNLLENGGFEKAEGLRPDGWLADKAEIAVIKDSGEQGNAAVIRPLSGNDTSSFGMHSTPVGAKGGRLYSAWFKAKTENVQNAMGFVRFFDADKGFIGQKGVNLSTDRETYSMHEIAGAKAPANTEYADFFISCTNKPGAGVYLGSIDLREVKG